MRNRKKVWLAEMCENDPLGFRPGQPSRWSALPVCLQPIFQVLLNLFNVMRNVVGLNLKPPIQGQRSLSGNLRCMRPHCVRDEFQYLVSHLP